MRSMGPLAWKKLIGYPLQGSLDVIEVLPGIVTSTLTTIYTVDSESLASQVSLL